MKFIKVALVVFVLAGVPFFIGCKKAQDSPFTSEYENMMKENALAQAAFDDVLKVTENILMNNGDAKIASPGTPLSCYTSIDSTVTGVNQKHYTVTFNPECTSYDGKKRAGQFLFDLTGASYNDSGAVLIITFDNYKINKNLVKGRMIVTNEGHRKFKVTVGPASHSAEYASVNIFATGKTIQWKSNHVRIIEAIGDGDNIIINNKYKIKRYKEGVSTFEGITSDSKYYSANPSSPLVLDYSCRAIGILRYPLGGVLDFDMGGNKRSVNYGDTTICNTNVIMTCDGLSADYNLY